MDIANLIDVCAEALYAAWRNEEVQRRREEETLGMRVMRPGGIPPVFEALDNEQRALWHARARPMVFALEERNALVIGDPELWDVIVDDPDLEGKYEYHDVSCFSAHAAAYEGARRACLEDPLRFMSQHFPDGTPFPYLLPTAGGPTDSIARTNPGLIEAVAQFTFVYPAGQRHKGFSGEELWTGYR